MNIHEIDIKTSINGALSYENTWKIYENTWN